MKNLFIIFTLLLSFSIFAIEDDVADANASQCDTKITEGKAVESSAVVNTSTQTTNEVEQE